MTLGMRSTVLMGAAAGGISLAAGAFLLLTPSPSADGNRFGSVHFPISCASVQDKFDHAVGLLHNFSIPRPSKPSRRSSRRIPIARSPIGDLRSVSGRTRSCLRFRRRT